MQDLLPETVEYKQLSTLQKQECEKIMQGINFADRQSMAAYATHAQKEIADFADEMLKKLRVKDAGESGELLSELLQKIKDLKIEKLQKQDFFANVPLVGKYLGVAGKFLQRYDKIGSQITKITGELEKTRLLLLREISLLDGLYTKNSDFYKQLSLYLIAGKEKLTVLKNTGETQPANSILIAQEQRDFNDFVAIFENKLHDIQLSLLLCLQTSAQIRLVQNNTQALAEKMQSAVFNLVPLWKNQVLLAVTLLRQQKASAVYNMVTSASNQILEKNSQVLKTATLSTAKNIEKGITDLETLQKINSDLQETLTEALKIQKSMRAKRETASVELRLLEEQLRESLLQH